MLAIIETGGKQYTVKPGTIIDIETINTEIGNTVSFDKVLLFSEGDKVQIGQPYVKNATVNAKVLNQVKADKVVVFKFKRKTGYQKKQGHRQAMTTIKVEEITTGSSKNKAAADN